MSQPRDDEHDSEWLLKRERGEDVGEVPAEVRAPYERLSALIGRGVAPSPGFGRRVLDAIDAIEAAEAGGGATAAAAVETPAPAGGDDEVARARRRRRRILGGAITAIAAAAAVILWLRRAPAPTPRPALALERSDGGAGQIRPAGEPAAGSSGSAMIALATRVRPTGAVVREAPVGDEAKVGDTLSVRAETRGPAELRVYGGSRGQQIARCDDQGAGGPPACQIDREGEVRRFQLEVPLEVPGTVKAVVFLGPSVPAPTGTLDADLEAAAVAGIEHQGDERSGTIVR